MKTQAKIVINIGENNSKITMTVICINKFVEAMVLHNVPNSITLCTSYILKYFSICYFCFSRLAI